MINTQWDRIPIDAPPLTRISENFRLYELTVSETADRLGLADLASGLLRQWPVPEQAAEGAE